MDFHKLPALNQSYINKQNYFFLFESNLCDKNNHLSYVFSKPIDIIKARNFEEVESAFKKIQSYSKNYYIAGYLAYELGYYFQGVEAAQDYGFPLVNMAVFKNPMIFNHKDASFQALNRNMFGPNNPAGKFSVKGLGLTYNYNAYSEKILYLKNKIKNGDTYQVNFTGRFNFNFSGCPYSFYNELKEGQNVSYSAFCKLGDEHLISLSPELFFKRNGREIIFKPMKGTISRGRDLKQDRKLASELRTSSKNLAENLMIVDLVRNDLGRICETGSVKVNKLFEIEKYDSLFQMTSTVKGILKNNLSYFEIFKNIFPSGSVTGAPKISTMKIIKDIESVPRKVYCGALGFIAPDNKAVFNLPIRTILLKGGSGQMGVGSGIVADSDSAAEFNECLLKARFLINRKKAFEIVETILWKGKFIFLKEHLERMQESALYFGFNFNRRAIQKRISQLCRDFKKDKAVKVRVLLEKDGSVRFEHSLINSDKDKKKYIALARTKIDPEDIFLYHKTTNRKIYQNAYKTALSKGYSDVIFMNTLGEITEGAISNIFIKVDRKYFTPPVKCGLLPGIYRSYLVKKLKASEKVIRIDDLMHADKIFLCNSIRGVNEVFLNRKDK